MNDNPWDLLVIMNDNLWDFSVILCSVLWMFCALGCFAAPNFSTFNSPDLLKYGMNEVLDFTRGDS
jgi:hypothetical protein